MTVNTITSHYRHLMHTEGQIAVALCTHCRPILLSNNNVTGWASRQQQQALPPPPLQFGPVYIYQRYFALFIKIEREGVGYLKRLGIEDNAQASVSFHSLLIFLKMKKITCITSSCSSLRLIATRTTWLSVPCSACDKRSAATNEGSALSSAMT